MAEVLSSRIVGLEELFHLGHFKPAAVQRDFEWGRTQSGQVLKDILDLMAAMQKRGITEPLPDQEPDAFEEPEDDDDGAPIDGISLSDAADPALIDVFFLGSIILYPAGEGEYEIFDGLQRLTMLTILLAVLRDRLNDATLKDRLHALIDDIPIKRFRLAHRGTRQILPKLVQPLGEAGKIRHQTTRPDWAAGQRVFDVARYFRTVLPEKDQDYIKAIAQFLLDHLKISLVLIANRRLARQTFIATNLYGIPLRRDEIFKSELLALAPDDATRNRIEGVWNAVRQKVCALEKTHENGAAAGKLPPPKFEQFLTCVDLIERRQPQSVDCLGDLITHLDKRAQAGTLNSWLGSLNTLADAWVRLEGCLKDPRPGDIVEHHIWTLNFFKWQEWRPLALYWMERYATGRLQANSLWRFERLGARCMAVTLLDLDAKTRSDMFLKALQLTIRNRRPFDDSKRRLPLNFSKLFRTRMHDALSLPIENYEVRRTLILWYETSLWGTEAPQYIRGASVEHILPGRCGGNSQWLKDFPDVTDRYVHHASLGNLGLVDWKLQRVLSNLDYAPSNGKKDIFASHDQFEKYKCMKDVAHIDQWIGPAITARTKTAATHIWGTLGLPDPD